MWIKLGQPRQDLFDEELNPGMVQLTIITGLEGRVYGAAPFMTQHYKKLGSQEGPCVLERRGYF